MVHCHVVVAHPGSIDAIEDCVADRSSGNNNETIILVDWRNQHKNDADLVVVDQYYGATP